MCDNSDDELWFTLPLTVRITRTTLFQNSLKFDRFHLLSFLSSQTFGTSLWIAIKYYVHVKLSKVGDCWRLYRISWCEIYHEKYLHAVECCRDINSASLAGLKLSYCHGQKRLEYELHRLVPSRSHFWFVITSATYGGGIVFTAVCMLVCLSVSLL